MVVEITGLAWFSEDDYAQARELMSDEGNLPEDYSRWLRGAETTWVGSSARLPRKPPET